MGRQPGPTTSSTTRGNASKIAFAKLAEKANTAAAVAFPEELVAAIPYRIEMVLTDDSIQFADLTKSRKAPTAILCGRPLRPGLQAPRSPHPRGISVSARRTQ